MKKSLLKMCAMVVMMVVLLSIQCVAAEEKIPQVLINGVCVEFDVSPVIEEDRTLIPIRAVSENLGFEVLWDEKESKVEIKNGEEKLELFIGKQSYLKNGVEKQIDVPPKIKNGRTLVPLGLIAEEFGCTVRWVDEEYTAEIVKYETVYVNTAKDFLEAIGSYKRVVLSEGEYNLSKVDEFTNEHVKTHNPFDGTEYIINEVTDLIIEGAEGEQVTIVIEPRYANVLCFMYGEHITLKNVTAGHTVEGGYCIGGVVKFEECKDATVENCKLYGCGVYGVTTVNSDTINVKNTDIYDCTYGVVCLLQSKNVFFNNCIFRDSKEFSMFYIDGCSNIGVYNSEIKNNESIDCALIESVRSDKVHFKNCKFENNICSEIATEDVYFENCEGNK